MTNYQQLANELKGALAKYRTEQPVKRTLSPKEKIARRREMNRRYVAAMRERNRKPTNWGKLQTKRLFDCIANLVGISKDAARARYYRHQLPANVIEQARAKMN